MTEKQEPPSSGTRGAELGPGQAQGRLQSFRGPPGRAVSWARSRLGLGGWAVFPNQGILNQDLSPELDTKKDSISSPSVIACDLINPSSPGVRFISFLLAGWRLCLPSLAIKILFRSRQR